LTSVKRYGIIELQKTARKDGKGEKTMEKNNLKKGLYYCNMDGVYKFISNGFLGDKPASAFWVCEYDEELGRYEETSSFYFMDAEELLTLTLL
jgi:hypothetical protein